MTVCYLIEESILDTLTVVNEVHALMGMLPEKIVTDNEQVRFSGKDYKKLLKGLIDEKTYITNNIIL
ncbi:hypothetical protein EZS27_003564 [termite gut metagenome]|uniref:Uncharacterized protein n=1 Tax=termite gut metagenome TaxID=433724 RepID=A0A5J4SS09_9ZZZZ